MKKVLILVLLLTSGSLAMGQGFSGQLIIGINGSQIDGDDYSGYYKAGLLAGAAVRFPLSDHWSIQPEILYSQKGSAYKIDKQTYTLYDLKYLEFPIIFRYKMDNGLAIEAGPAIAAYLDGKFIDLAGLEADPGFANRSPADLLAVLGMEYHLTDGLAFNIRLSYSALVLPPSTFNPQPNRNNTLSFSLRIQLFGGRAETEL